MDLFHGSGTLAGSITVRAKVVPATTLATPTVALAEPPGPLQASAYEAELVSCGVVSLPLTGRLPDHAPDAVHDVAFVEDHASVDVPPLATVVGLAVNVTVGAGTTGWTDTVTEAVAVPPEPEHVSENMLVASSGDVDRVPDVARFADHAPDAAQELALVDLHVSVVLLPLTTDVGLAVSATVGAGCTVCTVTVVDAPVLPPTPEHVRAKMLVAASGAVD